MRWFVLIALIGLVSGCTGNLLRRDDATSGPNYSPFSISPSRIDISPSNVSKPTKKDVLLVATVYDKDGSTLRRKPVEWSIEGPGEFVVVDDGGWFTSRGKKSGSKSALTTTHNFEEKLDKKTYSSSTEEPVIKPGQTWVVVSSAVEGKTVVTAVCPDVSDRDRGRVVATIIWSDSEVGFPSSTAAPAGGETTLRTDLARVASLSGSNGFRVRYRILSGSAATLKLGGGAAVASLAGSNVQDVITNADADGTAGVRIVQSVPAAGTTRVAIDVIKPDPNGVGPGTVVAHNETNVEWTSPQLSLDLRGPALTGTNSEVPYTIVVANSGRAVSPQVTVRSTLPNNVALISSDPPPAGQQNRDVSWVVPPVASGGKQEIKLIVKPVRTGPFDLTATAITSDGMRADQKITATADTAALRVAIDAPALAPIGELVPVRVTVTNTGAVPIDSATAWITGSEGLMADRREAGEPGEIALGSIPAGRSVTGDVMMSAARAGKYTAKATVTADGGLKESASATIDARSAGMKLDVTGPDRVGVGEPATYLVKLKNTGDMTLSSIAVNVDMPKGLNATDAEGGAVTNAGTAANWKVANLNAGETKQLKLTTVGDKTGPGSTLFASASVGLSNAKPIEVKAQAPVAVAGLPAIELELAEPANAVPMGGKATFRITVRNRGTGSARDVQIAVEAPTELSLIKGRGTNGDATLQESRLVFPAIPSLATGAAITVYADVEAVRPGSARVRAVATSPDLPNPVREEQSMRVSSGGK